MRERARGDEKNLKAFVLGIEKQPQGVCVDICAYARPLTSINRVSAIHLWLPT